MEERKCKVKNGKTYCKEDDKWVLVDKKKNNIKSDKSFKSNNSFNSKKSNVC